MVIKNLPANAGGSGDLGSVPRLGRSPGGGNGNPLQYSCLGESHEQRNLEGYRGQKESDTTEYTPFNGTHLSDLSTHHITWRTTK